MGVHLTRLRTVCTGLKRGHLMAVDTQIKFKPLVYVVTLEKLPHIGER